MDPGQLTDINSMRVLSSVYDTLVRFKEESFTLEPGLATSWTISGDGLQYTFKLRQGVKFNDGSPFNAEAVKFTYDRLLDPKHPYASTGPFPFAGFYYGAVKQVTALDPSTVRFTLKQPFSPLLNNLTLNTGRIVSPAGVKKWGKEFASHPTGTGPFKFVSWEKNVRIVLEANPDFWDGRPRLDRPIFRPRLRGPTPTRSPNAPMTRRRQNNCWPRQATPVGSRPSSGFRSPVRACNRPRPWPRRFRPTWLSRASGSRFRRSSGAPTSTSTAKALGRTPTWAHYRSCSTPAIPPQCSA